jgi:hypothetical protein
MIEIGQRTKIWIGDGGNIIKYKLIEFYELVGTNVLYICDEDDRLQRCSTLICKRDTRWEDFSNKIKESLFRIDVILVGPNKFYHDIKWLINSEIKLPTIYFSNEPIPKFGIQSIKKKPSYNYNYVFYRGENREVMLPDSREYLIKSVDEDWVDSVENLKKKWLREKNLEELLNKK